MKFLQSLLLAFTACFTSFSTHAYYSTMDTGSLLEKGKFKSHLETQFITSNNSGLNLNGRFDMGLTKDSGFRGIIGFGTTDFHLGGFYKWVPIPDIHNQPAIGLLAGVAYASFSGINDLSLRFHPIVSKTFEFELGEITPYGSLPIGIRSMNRDHSSNNTDIPIQLTLGAELKTLHWEKVTFMSEINFDIQHTFSYFSLGVNVEFDEEGIQFE